MSSWSGHIRRYRRTHGFTQAAFAEMLGVEQATVSRWERGTHLPELGIQRRLRDLMSHQILADSLIVHRVRTSLSAMKLANRRGQNVAASQEAARLHGLDADRLSRLDYSLLFTETLNHQWEVAHREGFFGGQLASIRVFNPWLPAGGGQVRFCEGAWTPVFLSDGEILLVSEFREIHESAFEEISPLGKISVTSLDDLV